MSYWPEKETAVAIRQSGLNNMNVLLLLGLNPYLVTGSHITLKGYEKPLKIA